MKFKFLLIAVVMIFALTTAPDAKAGYSNAISGDALGLLFSHYLTVTYEFTMSPTNSLSLFGTFYSSGGWDAFGFGASYRWYIVKSSKQILEGFSFGPKAGISFWSGDDDGTSLAIGGEAAYKWIFGGFVVEPIISIMFPFKEYGHSGAYWVLGCNLGYAW